MEEKVIKLLKKHKKDKDLTAEKNYIRPGWDWSEARLLGWNLQGLNLSTKNYSACFKEVHLEQANLQSAILTRANLQSAILRYANLQDANLSFTDLQKANLTNSDLRGANLILADLQGAYSLYANIQRALLLYVNLQDANLSFADLQGSVLTGADLQGARLFHAKLQKANLTNSDLREGDLTGADLQGANLTDADLRGADLAEAKLQGADLTGADLQGADLTGADLQGADLNRANLKDAKFDDQTDLHKMRLYQCKLEGSTLRNAYRNLDKKVIEEIEKNFLKARDVYLILKNYFREVGMYDVSGYYYYRERIMERECNKQNKEWGKWCFNHLLEKIAGYGERPWQVVLWWVAIIVIWALNYWNLEGIMANHDVNYTPTLWEAIYFSGITFTSLGFGDLIPKPGFFQIVTLAEAILGAIFMAMFIFVFARKMIR